MSKTVRIVGDILLFLGGLLLGVALANADAALSVYDNHVTNPLLDLPGKFYWAMTVVLVSGSIFLRKLGSRLS